MINRELIQEFRNRVNKYKYIFNKYCNFDGKNKWSCICSCMDWISVAVSYLSEHPIPIRQGNEDLTSVNVYTYISCVDMVFEAIKQLHRIFVSEKTQPFENESNIFTENIYCKNDNDYFKLIRSCFGAHPVNLNDYFSSPNEKERRFASWSGGHFSRRDYGVVLYSNIPGTSSIFFDISFKEINDFLERSYSYLGDLISLIDGDEDKHRRALRDNPIECQTDPLCQLEILGIENKIRFDNDYYEYIIKELKLIFGTQITNPNNQIKVEQYKRKIVAAIDELRQKLQEMILDDIASYEENNQYGQALPHSVSNGFTELADSVFSETWSYPVFLPSLIEYISPVVTISDNESKEELYVLSKTAFYLLEASNEY